MKNIEFITSEDVKRPSFHRGLVRKWIESVAEVYGFRVGELCYRFCSDEEILQTNIQFLSHNYYTDIITFDDTMGDVLNGQMLISLDTVRTNAEAFGSSYSKELFRVIIHGVLHLTGQKDKTPEDEAIMHQKEDRALALLQKMEKTFERK